MQQRPLPKSPADAEAPAAGPARKPGDGARTRAERLRAELADDIACGRLLPGAPLDEMSLANRFGVSRTPVREAIRELAAAGLVDYRRHRGGTVAMLGAERVAEMFSVMAELEALCAAFAAEKMTSAERYTLAAMHEAAAEPVRNGDIEAYMEANDRFHEFIYAASHNGFLAETVLGVRRRVLAFRRAQFHGLGRLAISHTEHGRVVQALLRGDREAAAAEMRRHLSSSGQSYTELQAPI